MAKRKSGIQASSDKSGGDLAYFNVDRDSTGAKPDADSLPDFTAASLRQLEADIRLLQDRRLNVEQELRARDNRITQLLDDLDNRDARIDSLKDKLSLPSEDLDRLLSDVSNKEESSTLIAEQNEELKAQNADLCCKIHDLEMYVESRQDEWIELGDRLVDYQNAMAGMEQKIKELEAAASDDETDEPDFSNIFDLTDDSIIDIGIGSDEIEEPNSCAKLEILKLPAQQVLVAIDADGNEKRQYLLTKSETTIGRSPTSDIRMSNKYISREHARIIQEESQSIIEDLGSRNGFLINSEEKKRHQLQHGDRVSIGTEEFEFFDLSVSP